MPRSTDMTFACPCGTTFPTTVYQTVNVTLEPELLYRLLSGTLNVATCPNCGRKASSAQPFIYHDMARGLFAYVHPGAEVPEEDREALLATLRTVYTRAVSESERLAPPRRQAPPASQPRVRRRTPGEDLSARIEPTAPPMQVIFGEENLVELVDSLLEPSERLGRVAMTTRSPSLPERERLRTIAERMAGELGCIVDVEDAPQEYTAWIYGPRTQISVIARALGRE